MALDPVTAGLEAVAAACHLGAEFIKGMNDEERRAFYKDVETNRAFWAGIGAQFMRVFDPANWPKVEK